MDVLTFKVALKGLEDRLARQIEFLSNSLLSNFSYVILSSFNAEANHLFNVDFKENRFEYIFDNMDMPKWMICHNPSLYKLSDLKIDIDDTMVLEYDYGASYIFDIKLIDIKPMKKYTHMHYPYVIDGKGYGIIEDMPPCELSKIFEKEKGLFCDKDYNKFDIERCNMFLKDGIKIYKEAYEHHIINKKKETLNFNNIDSSSDKVIDFEVNKLWLSIPEDIRNMYLNTAFCHNCFSKHGGVSFKGGYKIIKHNGMLIIDGICEKCNGHIRRTCD